MDRIRRIELLVRAAEAGSFCQGGELARSHAIGSEPRHRGPGEEPRRLAVPPHDAAIAAHERRRGHLPARPRVVAADGRAREQRAQDTRAADGNVARGPAGSSEQRHRHAQAARVPAAPSAVAGGIQHHDAAQGHACGGRRRAHTHRRAAGDRPGGAQDRADSTRRVRDRLSTWWVRALPETPDDLNRFLCLAIKVAGVEPAARGMDFRTRGRTQGHPGDAKGRGTGPPGDHCCGRCGHGVDASGLLRPQPDLLRAAAASAARLDVSAGFSDLCDVSPDGSVVPQGAGIPEVRGGGFRSVRSARSHAVPPGPRCRRPSQDRWGQSPTGGDGRRSGLDSRRCRDSDGRFCLRIAADLASGVA